MRTKSDPSVDLDELLDDAVRQLEKAKENSETCSRDNTLLLESVIKKLNHIKERRETNV